MTSRASDRSLPVDVSIASEDIERDTRALEEVWGDKPGIWGWLSTVDHKKIAQWKEAEGTRLSNERNREP